MIRNAYFDTFKFCDKLVAYHLRDEQAMKAIALFYKLKLAYPSSKIYDYAPKNIAKRTGISVYLIEKLVKKLKDIGLAAFVTQYSKIDKKEHQTLLLRGLQDIKIRTFDKQKNDILILRNESIKETVFRLKSKSVENYVRRQQYVLDCKVDQQLLEQIPDYRVPLKVYKKIRKVVSKSGEELSEKTILSSRKAFKKFGINPCDYRKFQEFSHLAFGWRWNPGKKIIEHCPKEKFELSKRHKDRHAYWCKGYMVYQFPTEVYIPYITN
jgi:hypothetical protein